MFLFNPSSRFINIDIAYAFYYAREPEEAINQSRMAIDLDARFFLAHLVLGQSYGQKGRNAEAIITFQKGINTANPHPSLAFAQATAGRNGEGQKLLDQLQKQRKQYYISPYWSALIYAVLRDKEQALVWLEKTFQERSSMLIWLNLEPRFDFLRDNSRFADLLRRIHSQPS